MHIQEWIDGLKLSSNAEPRREIMLFPYGEFDHPTYGKLTFDDAFFNELIYNYQNKVLGTTPFIDKQHNEDEALAWLNHAPFIRPGQGLFIKPDWTKLGNTLLTNKIYRYFSPAWGPYKNPETGKEYHNVLLGGAATNVPFLKTMPPITDDTRAGSRPEMAEYKLSDLSIKSSPKEEEAKADEPTGEQTPETDKNIQGDIMKEQLIKMFSLSEDASDDSILAKVTEIIDQNKTFGEKIAEIEKKVNAEPDKELTQKLDETTKKLTAVEGKLAQRECDTAINKALSEGKIKPADREHWEKRFLSDPENVGKDLEIMSPIIKLGEVGSEGEGETVSNDPAEAIITKAKKICKGNDFAAAVKEVCEADPAAASAYYKKYRA